mmetsp:Transcript_5387/g.12349  ORF Transcript_5387/g.12349 Transcript_5387/m.12349 type:complete len:227 (-) Transcript_5387:6-686(-)
MIAQRWMVSTVTSENPALFINHSNSLGAKKRYARAVEPGRFCPRLTTRSSTPQRKVVAKNVPPGFSVRCTSLRPSWTDGQQWRAAPAWIASTEAVPNGILATSARTRSKVGTFSSSLRRMTSLSMFSEKSTAITLPNCWLLARRRTMRPDPHERSITVPFPSRATWKNSIAISNSFSIPGNPACLKPSRHPRSYRKDSTGVRKSSCRSGCPGSGSPPPESAADTQG